MYLSTYEERDNGSFYEEGYDGRNLSKLNLCEEGKLGEQTEGRNAAFSLFGNCHLKSVKESCLMIDTDLIAMAWLKHYIC